VRGCTYKDPSIIICFVLTNRVFKNIYTLNHHLAVGASNKRGKKLFFITRTPHNMINNMLLNNQTKCLLLNRRLF